MRCHPKEGAASSASAWFHQVLWMKSTSSSAIGYYFQVEPLCFVGWFWWFILLHYSLSHHVMKTCAFPYIPGQRYWSRAWEDTVMGSILGTVKVIWKIEFTTSIDGTHFSYHLKKIKFGKPQACFGLYYQYWPVWFVC